MTHLVKALRPPLKWEAVALSQNLFAQITSQVWEVDPVPAGPAMSDMLQLVVNDPQDSSNDTTRYVVH